MNFKNFSFGELEHKLGRRRATDDRDKAYSLKQIQAQKAAGIDSRYWNANGYWGDQGDNPWCVEYAWCHLLEDGPITQSGLLKFINGHGEIYHAAQEIDEWPGVDYDGTSVRAGAKVLQAKGIISNYYWAFNVQTIIDFILTTGPVVMGTNWYYKMFFPNSKTGIIEPDNVLAGGHAYVLNGFNRKTGLFRLKNSWGRGWGKKGHAFIHRDVVDDLVKDWGEACCATELKK